MADTTAPNQGPWQGNENHGTTAPNQGPWQGGYDTAPPPSGWPHNRTSIVNARIGKITGRAKASIGKITGIS